MMYPEHEKLSTIAEQSQTCGEFLDWLRGEGIHLMTYRSVTDLRPCSRCEDWSERNRRYMGGCRLCGDTGRREVEWETWCDVGRSTEALLADFFGIDRNQLEAEKREMLEALRAASSKEGED